MRDRAWHRQQRKRIIHNRLRLLRDLKDERAESLKGGYLVKRHPYDCGRTRCGVCHPHKKWKGNHQYPIRIRKEPLAPDLTTF